MPNVTINLPPTVYTKDDLIFSVTGSTQASWHHFFTQTTEPHEKDIKIVPVIKVNGVAANIAKTWSRPAINNKETWDFSWSANLTAPSEGPLDISVVWSDITTTITDDIQTTTTNGPAQQEPARTTQIKIDHPPNVSADTYHPNGTQTKIFECQAPNESIQVIVKGEVSDDRGVIEVDVGLDQQNLPKVSAQTGPWSATVSIPSELGARTIYVKAVDSIRNESTNNQIVTVVDTTAPDVTVSVPTENLIMDDQPVKFQVIGTARDKATGVKMIGVNLKRVGSDPIIATATANLSSNARNVFATWNTDLTIDLPGSYNVETIAEDNSSPSNSRHLNAVVTVQKVPMPVVRITSHVDGVIPGTDQGADITIKGTASAELSTVTDVRVILDNRNFDDPASEAVSESPDWSLWSKQIHIPPQGGHTIAVRCSNSAKNPELKYGYAFVNLRVGVEFKPLDKNNLSLLAYFKDLLDFALERILIKTSNNGTATERNATIDDLVQYFYQPFNRLQVDEEVLQIRICIEVLRQYLVTMNKKPDPDAEEHYRQAAYESLLTQFGISYEELRLAHRIRVEDEEDKKVLENLTARLGIEPDVDKLNQLLLSPKEITEEKLERLFGLVDTTRDPLASLDQHQLLFLWQAEHLHALWKKQDHVSNPGNKVPHPIIDPDLLCEADFLFKEGEAYNFWKLRSDWIVDQLKILEEKGNRPPGESDHDRLLRLVDKSLGQATMNELLSLDKKQQAGHDIAIELLAKHFLNLPAFGFLVRMYTLPADQGLLESEWNAVYSILVQAMKQREYDTWRTQENNLTLGPDYFKIAAEEPRLPEWRAPAQARRSWQETLQGRIDQQEALRKSFLVAVSSAEAVSLPTLREVLVKAVGQADKIDIHNWLTQRLMIDVEGNGAIKTTRITQAVETLQSILSALRTDRFMEMDNPSGWPTPPGDWERKLADAPASEIGRWFDQEWIWMSTFASWNAAMRIFLYPENLLLPNLREYKEENMGDMTTEFHKMLDDVRSGQQLTTAAAQKIANKYQNSVTGIQQVMDGLKTLDSDWQKKTFVLDDSMEEADLLTRAAAIKDLISRNKGVQPLQRYMAELFYFVPMQLAIELHQAGQYSAALDWFRTIYGYNLPVGQRKIWYGLTQEEAISSDFNRPDQWLRITLDPYVIARSRAIAFSRFTIISIARCFLDYADAEFSSESGEAIARARLLYLGALDLLDSADMRLPSGDEPAVAAKFNPNPEPQALRMHAEMSLGKLRSGRNIAGMQRQITTSLSKETGDQASSGFSLQPTPYRYSTLIERAKQLVILAQQTEERYLSALEKMDAETYNLLKAHHDLKLTQVTVQLQNLRVIEANSGKILATLQKSRAKIQQDTYKGWIDAGKIQAESDLLANYKQANEARNWVAGLNGAITVAQAITTTSSAGFLGTGLTWAYASAPVVAGLAVGKSFAQIAANNAEAAVQTNSFNASYERRKQEWTLQTSLAEKDVTIANQQIEQAENYRQIVSQEREIAQMQTNHAQATVDFLANKFTNVELYHWMSGVLGRVYNYFLQQATAIARMAEDQLAFERQEKPLSVIRSDYWQTTSETGNPGNTTDGKRDRRGLTGSARLLQDVYQLDQYAFETNKRKLQLSKTISLAQLAPFEFQYFRQTGVLPFATPMTLFDQDFPGHYLRLIRRVRTSVVALVPPNQGIRATLATVGLSRVTIAGGGFRNVLVRREPDLVALSSPLNSTGIFELDIQSELLLPFEGSGVDTTWMFEMPKAANPFDYRTIADVLITIEYTALHSFDYRQQVIQRLDRKISADRSFSLRERFPDQWYELNNPEQAIKPMTVSYQTLREDFPPNIDIDSIKIEHVLLYIIVNTGTPFAEQVRLEFAVADGQGQTVTGGGEAIAIDGVISTRRGNSGAWKDTLIGKPPFGNWTMTFLNVDDLKQRFEKNEIEDILFVITYSGETPAWPS